MRKFIFLLVILIVQFSGISYAVEIDGLSYALDQKDKSATLTACNVEGNVIIPESIVVDNESYIVKYIGEGGLNPDAIFQKATRIEIPASVESVRGGVFSTCSSIQELIFKDGDKDLHIVGKENSYNTGAFYHCWGLKYIYVGRPFTNVNLFYCTELSGSIKVEVGPNVKYISGFEGAPIDPDIDLSGIERIGSCAFKDTKISEVRLPKIKIIGYDAFKNCPVSVLELGNEVKEIGSYAFYNTKLTELILPASLEKVGEQAFNVKSIENITVEDSPVDLFIEDCNMFAEVPFKTLYLGRNIHSVSLNDFTGPFGLSAKYEFSTPSIEITFGKYVKRINRFMFANRAIKGKLVLPDSVENIMEEAFARGNEKVYVNGTIEYLKLPLHLKKCGYSPFLHRHVKEVEIPDGITFLSGDLMPGKPSKIRIPSSVESVANFSEFKADTIIIEDRNKQLNLINVTFTADYVYCGSPLSFPNKQNAICFDRFEIGSTVSYFGNTFLTCKGDSPVIISNPLLPPEVIYMDKDTYENARVIIEYNSNDEYRKSIYWNKCLNFENFITLSCSELELEINQSYDLQAKINELFSADNSLVWSSSNENIVTVENGVIYAKKVGSRCKITATDKYGHTASCMVKVTPVFVQSLSVEPQEWNGKVGSTVHLSATVLPENATDKTLTWKSSDESVAIVDAEGNVTAVGAGEASITAIAVDRYELSAVCHIKVDSVLVTSITLSQNTWSGKEGETFAIKAEVLPEDATYRSILWASSDESVATVDEDGNVMALGIGDADITATAADGSGVSATCHVTVLPEFVGSVSLTPDSWIGKVGESITIHATVLPETVTDKSLIWSSSDESVAIVDFEGNVTAISLGKADITATAADGSGVSATCQVTVIPIRVGSVELTPDSWSGHVGETFTIIAAVLPENVTDKSLIWSSGDESVAAVDSEGNVTALSPGEADITATAADGSGVSATCHVTVHPKLVGSVELTPDNWSGHVGETFTIIAAVLPENVTDKSLIWSSGDESVAAVDSEGNVTALSPGEADITATAADGSGVSATCHVTVLPVLVESIVLTPDTWSGEAGMTVQIDASVLPENASEKKLRWVSSDKSVAIVDEDGFVVVLKEGSCVITATATDGSGVYAECIVTGLAGIEEIFSESDLFDLYDLNGILIKKDGDREDLKTIAPGIYIIRIGNTMKKIVIR